MFQCSSRKLKFLILIDNKCFSAVFLPQVVLYFEENSWARTESSQRITLAFIVLLATGTCLKHKGNKHHLELYSRGQKPALLYVVYNV